MARFLDRLRRVAALAGTVAVVAALIGGCSSSTTASAAPPEGVRPGVVLVHGAWADTSSWDGEVSALMKRGYDVRAIANPLKNLTTDSEYVSAFL